MKKTPFTRKNILLTVFLTFLCAFCFGTAQSANAAENADETCFAFTYFTRNGEDGLHLLVSRDARKWEVTNAGKSYLAPMKGGLSGSGRNVPSRLDDELVQLAEHRAFHEPRSDQLDRAGSDPRHAERADDAKRLGTGSLFR